MKWSVFSIVLFFMLSCQKEENPVAVASSNGVNNITIINDVFEQQEIVVLGNENDDLLTSFSRRLNDGTILLFSPYKDYPIVMKDQEGGFWNVLGFAISGRWKGERLQALKSTTGYWFAWAAIFPGIEIFEGENRTVDVDCTPALPIWNIPQKGIAIGAAQNAIVSLLNPPKVLYKQKDFINDEFFLENEDKIVGLWTSEGPVAYPHAILDWHEIINEQMPEGNKFTVLYCPLSGTGMVWELDKSTTTDRLGISGYLYNNNLMTFDYETNSVWSQMLWKCVKGPYIGQEVDFLHSFETTWETWKKMFPDSKVVSEDTGFNFDYGDYPYGNYPTDDNDIFFSLSYDDDRLPRKERVHGVIINDKAKVYRFSSF